MNAKLIIPAILCGLVFSGCGSDRGTVQVNPQAAPTPANANAPATVKNDEPKPEPKDDEKKPEEKKADAGGEKKPAADTQELKFSDGNTIVIPKTWVKETPSSGMRALQIKVPKVEGDAEDAELSGFKMPRGGGAEANIKRWVDQFGGKEEAMKNRKTIKTAAGEEAIIVELEGTFTNTTMAGQQPPKAGYVMLGAIVGDFFFKFPGPKKTIEANKAAFEKMIESLK